MALSDKQTTGEPRRVGMESQGSTASDKSTHGLHCPLLACLPHCVPRVLFEPLEECVVFFRRPGVKVGEGKNAEKQKQSQTQG